MLKRKKKKNGWGKKERKKKPTDLKGLDKKKAEKWVHSVEHCSHEIKTTLFG